MMIYTRQRSKLSKKQRAAREAVIKEQRAIKKQLKGTCGETKLSFIDPVCYRRGSGDIASLGASRGFAAKRYSPVYTGTAMIGISQMHKSNAVPVFDTEDAQAIAEMR
jgi:hypothetical protein